MSFWRKHHTGGTSLLRWGDREASTGDHRTGRVTEESVPRSRAGTAFVGVAVAALIAIALLIFMMQNTGVVEVSFLGLTTRTSLAVTLVLAALGGALLTLILGSARILQLRRLLRERGSGQSHES